MSDVTVTLRHDCRFPVLTLSKPCIAEISKAFTHKNPQYYRLQAMGYPAQGEPRQYKTFAMHSRGIMSVWRGGAARLAKILKKHGHNVLWKDDRLGLKYTGLKRGGLKLRPYQLAGAGALIKQQQGVLRGKTGSGKTETLLGAIVAVDRPALVIVWNKDLQRQWVNRIERHGIMPARSVGGLGGVFNKPKDGQIVIAMQQSLVRHLDKYTGRFGTVVMDECQRAPAATFIKTVVEFPARYRWGASADERRTDGKEFLAYDAFGGIVHEMDSGEKVLDPEILIIPTEYQDPLYEDDRNYTEFLNRVTKDGPRNGLIGTLLRKELQAGRQIILFTDRTEAAWQWVGLVRDWGYNAGPLVGGAEDADETRATIDLMQSGKVQFGASTSYADAALDIPTIDCGFITCPTGGNDKRLGQQVGRTLRPHPGKGKPRIYYFWDRDVLGISGKVNKLKRKWKDQWRLVDE